VRDNAVLVVSEIFSNALKHARPLEAGRVSLAWQVMADAVRVEVSDGGASTRPALGAGRPSSTGGRGLGIVATWPRGGRRGRAQPHDRVGGRAALTPGAGVVAGVVAAAMHSAV
jgi:two-component sensor histidine kinase